MIHQNIGAKKALGQHFLLDKNLARKIARAAGNLTQSTVVEIGPGSGSLTCALLEEGAKLLIAIERDRCFFSALTEMVTYWPGRLLIVEEDALHIGLASIGTEPRCIVSNLPYNISVPLLLHWLREIHLITAMTLTFQKEVAERIVAKPGQKEYGRLSVITQWLCRVQTLFDIAPYSFTPSPRVTSTLLRLEPRQVPLQATWHALEKVTRAGFNQRRKMLRQSLKKLGDAKYLCATAGLPETARAEDIDIIGFCSLARALTQSRS